MAAFDAETGKEIWRFFNVPGDPAKGFENEAMKKAAATWSGEWWKIGGGGSVWDAAIYDPATDLLYYGTGNGTPWNALSRDPKRGDNLYIASIMALKADTGEYAWHYQATPGDNWDYDSTSPMMTADLTIGGAAAACADPAEQERFPLRARREDRRAAQRRRVHRSELGHRHRHEDRAPEGRGSGALREGTRGTWPLACRADTAGIRTRSIPKPASSTSRHGKPSSR